MTQSMTPQEAIKAIGPGSVTEVMFRFEAIGGGVAFVKTAKVHARAALRQLIPGARVNFAALGKRGDTVLISGPIPLTDRGEQGEEL